MLMAHLSGLLKPGYPKGIISVFAENAILDALEIQHLAEWKYREVLVDQAFVPLMNRKDVAKTVYSNVSNTMQKLKQISKFDLQETAETANCGKIEDVVKLYYELSKVGLVSAVDDEDEQQNN